jgi:arsenite methyltransferase
VRMAVTCPAGFDEKRLRKEVSAMYSRVARRPGGNFHFHRGPEYAAKLLGYDPQELETLPARATRSFAGVANPFLMGAVKPGETVVDIGSGSGMDLLLAARQGAGLAIGVDMTDAMLERARAAVASSKLRNVELRKGDAEALPVEDESADLVISNGVLNLTTDKEMAFSEIFRILKPGGRLRFGDIVVESELSEGIRSDIDLWAA